MTYPAFVEIYNAELDVTKRVAERAVDDWEAKGWTRVVDVTPVEPDVYVTLAQLEEAVTAAVSAAVTALIGAVIVVHGDDANVARPDVTVPVVWFGTVDPVNADDDLDIYVPVAEDT